MYFGDYLVEKKIINQVQLIEALCFQIESLPSLIRIVLEENITSADTLLDIIKKDAKDDQDILLTLVNRKIVDAKKASEIELKQVSKRVPLGEIIVKLNMANSEDVNKALQDFYDNKFNINEESTSNDSGVELNSAALESLKELGMSLDASPTNVVIATPANPFIAQYLDLFSDKYKNKLKKLISIIAKEVDGPSDISNYYNSLYRDLHLLKGTINLCEFKIQDELVSVWEREVEKTVTKPNDEIRSWCKLKLPLLDRSIDLLWYARGVIEKNQNEQNLSTDNVYLIDANSIIDKIA
jgi:hypothetical protein